MMMRTLSLHVTYGSTTKLINTTQTNFFSEVSTAFNIPPDEIEIYDNKIKKKIPVERLKSVHKIEVMKKDKLPKANGQNNFLPEPGEQPTTSEQLCVEEICRKLTENRALTGLERKLLCERLQNTERDLKRKSENQENGTRPTMKSRKVQVNAESLLAPKFACTQTDNWINDCQKPSTSAKSEIVNTGKRLAGSEKIDPRKASDIMSKGFDDRRHFMLFDRPLVCFVKEKYPLLFSLSEVQNELDRIFYVGKSKEFLSNIEIYAQFVLDLARHDDPLLRTIKEKTQSLKTDAAKKYAVEVGSLLMTSSVNFEERTYLKLNDEPWESIDTPYIEGNMNLDELYLGRHTQLFRIIVEGEVLCAARDFKDAILCLMASYFIFNIKYPDVNFNTMVMFEKLYLKANDTDVNEVADIVKQNVKFVQLKFDNVHK